MPLSPLIRKSASASRSRARTIAPPVRARPARGPRPIDFQGNCLEVRPGRHLHQHRRCRTASHGSLKPLIVSRQQTNAGKRRRRMNAMTRPHRTSACGNSLSAFRRTRSPGWPAPASSTNTCAAILAEGSARWLLRGPRRELHGRRRPAASCARAHPPRQSRVAAWRVHVDRRPAAARQGASRSASASSSSATNRRWSPSISPGRRTRRPIFNDLLPLALHGGDARQGLRPYR